MKGPKAKATSEATGPLRPVRPDRGTSAGGGYSTALDLLRFATALTSHRLLDAAHTKRLTTGMVETGGPSMKYAYGFGDQLTPDGVRMLGHTGGNAGINAALRIFPESGYVVVAFANIDPPTATEAAQFIYGTTAAQVE